MTDIRQDLKTIKSEVELKTGTILSKSQSILDKVKSTPDLVSKINDDTSANIKNAKQTTSNQAKQTDQKDQHKIMQGQKGSNKAPECIQTPMANDAIITISDYDTIKRHEHQTIRYRCYKKFNEDDFLKELANSLNALSISQTESNENFDNLSKIILNVLNKHSPLKSKRVKREKQPDWINEEIKEAC